MAWLLLVAWVWHLERRTGITPETCLIHGVFGVPCPTCGSTRVVLHLSGGRLDEALRSNPLVALGLLAGTVALVLRVAAGRWFRVDLSPMERRWAGLVGLAILLANWFWVLRHP